MELRHATFTCKNPKIPCKNQFLSLQKTGQKKVGEKGLNFVTFRKEKVLAFEAHV